MGPPITPATTAGRGGPKVGSSSCPELGGAGHVGKQQVSLGLVSRGGGFCGDCTTVSEGRGGGRRYGCPGGRGSGAADGSARPASGRRRMVDSPDMSFFAHSALFAASCHRPCLCQGNKLFSPLDFSTFTPNRCATLLWHKANAE